MRAGAEGVDRFALVTGASSGTGREIAKTLAAHGYAVGLAGRNVDELDATRGAIESAGGRARAFAFDIRDDGASERALDAFLEWAGGGVEVLVNAAAVPGPMETPVGSLSMADFDLMIETNLRGPFLTMSKLIPVMTRQGRGRVINIGGNHGMRGRAGRAGYSTSKWGLRGLTRCAALEAGGKGVTVNYLAPGPIAVERMKRFWAERARREGVDPDLALKGYIAAMGPVLGKVNEPSDVAAMVLFLVGEGGRNITGQELVIDGGIVV